MRINKPLITRSSFNELVKFRLSFAVACSALAGYALVEDPNWWLSGLLFLGVFLFSGAAAALNEVQEVKQDALMKRTVRRPLVNNKVSTSVALIVIASMFVLGTLVLMYLNPLSALLGWFNVVVYNLIYTPLKRVSTFAVLPGALVGAIPPLMGYVAAGGAITHPNIIYFVGFMFLWQVPHFFLLLIKYGKEYENAGFASLSVNFDANQIKYLVIIWLLITSGYLLMFPLFGFPMSMVLFVAVFFLNVLFIAAFYKLLFAKKESLKNAFLLINVFMLGMLFLFVMVS